MFSELKKYEQYQDIPYIQDYHCPCGESGFFDLFKVIQKPNIVGWCDTHIGYMIVFECPVCKQLFRTHASLDRFDFESFKYVIENYWELIDYTGKLNIQDVFNTSKEEL